MQSLQDRFLQWFKTIQKTPKWILGTLILVCIVGLALWVNPSGETQTGTILSDPTANPASLAINTFLKFGIVLALIFLGFYLLRRWQFRGPGVSKKHLSIIDTLYLNPRRTVYLIQAGERKLVLGATDQSISLLTELLPEDEINQPIGSTSTGLDFSDILDESIQK